MSDEGTTDEGTMVGVKMKDRVNSREKICLREQEKG
jgi:hypothetical protein